ncbi:MAG: hypothetical protein OXC95_18695, partial [Dehalococcoidia bacterium]|nr:hypothetical protein [Dehalococcoidia bacterium]
MSESNPTYTTNSQPQSRERIGIRTNLTRGPSDPEGFANLYIADERIGHIYPEKPIEKDPDIFIFEPNEFVEGILIYLSAHSIPALVPAIEYALIEGRNL